MGRTRMFGKINHNLENKKGGTIILDATNCRDLIHIPIKLHEDIPVGY